MPNFFARYIVKPLRPFLLKIISLAEKDISIPRAQKISFWKREIHIPTWLVAAIVWVMLYVVLMLEFDFEWTRTFGLFIFTSMIMTLFTFYIHHDHPDIVHDEDAVTLLGLLIIVSVLLSELPKVYHHWISPYGVPLAAASILTSLLLRPRLAVIITIVLSLIFGMINGFSFEGALVMCFGGMTGVAKSLSVRTRGDISRAGLWIVLTEGLAIFVLALIQGWSKSDTLFALRWVCVGGFSSALIAIAVLPYLESFFSRLTNIKLLELSDVNHPLLKRMSLEAPGTYHHSLIMASLAQAAAERVGANGLLCRVGAYFHDIGKMVKPEYFVENQGALGNPHDPLPPNMSRLVIQAHVKEGMALALHFGLDKAITDFICMHHGTSRIEYFYRRAIEQSADIEDVDEDEYRYPGPKPNTKETAIVMLADAIEASIRVLESPTHQRIKDQVKKIIDTKTADGQFDFVHLTLSDLSQISESFLNTLVGVYHARMHDSSDSASSANNKK